MITIKLALYIIALVHLFFVLLNYIFFLLAIYHKEGIFYKYRKRFCKCLTLADICEI